MKTNWKLYIQNGPKKCFFQNDFFQMNYLNSFESGGDAISYIDTYAEKLWNIYNWKHKLMQTIPKKSTDNLN